MAKDCGDSCVEIAFEGLSATYKKILWIVVSINFAMFLIESVAGFLAGHYRCFRDRRIVYAFLY